MKSFTHLVLLTVAAVTNFDVSAADSTQPTNHIEPSHFETRDDSATQYIQPSHQVDLTKTRVLTIENVVSTSITTVHLTHTVYPTCTTTAQDVTQCPGETLRLEGFTNVLNPTTSSEFATQQIGATNYIATHGKNPSMEQSAGGSSSTYQVAEVVMPSCDCLLQETSKGARSPRLFSDEIITIRSTTTLTASSVVTTTNTDTTVSITYNGCVPQDAPTTTICHNQIN